jgi:hypothetical protein
MEVQVLLLLLYFNSEGAGTIDCAETDITAFSDTVGGTVADDVETVGGTAGEVDVIVAGFGEGVKDRVVEVCAVTR